MDLLEQFDSLIDAAELDLRPRVKRAVREVVDFETRYVPAAIAAEIVPSRLETPGKALVAIIEGRDKREWVELVADLRRDLREAFARERESGELKPWSAAGEIERTIDRQQAWKYEPRLVDLVQRKLEIGETLLDWLPREVVTSKHRWDRRDLINDCRLVTETNATFFAQKFLSDEQVRQLEIEADAVEQQRKVSAHPWTLNGNRDLPTGARS